MRRRALITAGLMCFTLGFGVLAASDGMGAVIAWAVLNCAGVVCFDRSGVLA